VNLRQLYQFFKCSLIAVSYEARAKGVKRGMMCPEALSMCPDLNLVTVPDQRGKADLSKYRQASAEVFAVLNTFDDVIVERASIDEAYLDLTVAVQRMNEPADGFLTLDLNDFATSFLAVGDRAKLEAFFHEVVNSRDTVVDGGFDDDLRLLMGAKLVETMRQRIQEETQFHCSAGIGHNKVDSLSCKDLAKFLLQ